MNNETNKLTPDYLEYHIDDPVKKSVVGFALLGFTPVFSCCGFTYKDEKIRKDHFKNKSYIFLDYTSMNSTQRSLLVDITVMSGWTIESLNNQYIDFHSYGWDESHPWNFDGCLHKPEKNVLALNRLEFVLTGYKAHFLPSVSIEDGNYIYKVKRNIKYWQYESSSPWVVTPEIFESL